jgi:hypothetical protein
MEYRVVYDFSRESYAWWGLLVSLGIVIIALFSWSRRAYIPGPTWWRSLATPMAVAVIAFTVCGTTYGLAASFSKYNDAQQILREDRAIVIEGPVENLKYERAIESFTVDGITFDYANADTSPGFHTTSQNGGPINKNGLYVRVHYAYISGDPKPSILKLEIKQ